MLSGAKPKADRSQVVHRNPIAEWTEVENVPFDGPALPRRRDELSPVDEIVMAAKNEAPIAYTWPTQTLRWWEAVRTMPHCKLWGAADWEVAFTAAEIHARTMEGWKGYTGPNLLQREKLMGMYADARRDLRIRYVEPKAKAKDNATPADVLQLDAYRDL